MAINSGPAPGVGEGERRVASRVPVDRAVEIRLLDAAGAPADQPIPARLADLSASGVGLRVSRPIGPGKHILLVPPSGGDGDGAAPVNPLRYRVVRCKPLGGGQFHVGACFVRNPVKSG